MSLIELAIPFFLIAVVVEVSYGLLVKCQTYNFSDSVSSLQLGMISRLIGLLRLSFAGLVVTKLVSILGITPYHGESGLIWCVYFVLYDFLYYWKHRYGHYWRIMWASHVAHHQSEEFNLSTALRQTGTDYLGFVFFLPLFFLGISSGTFILIASVNLIYQFWVHTEHIKRLGYLDKWLVTPSNHRVHHATNTEYLDKNFGGVFIVWDRLFGTFCNESMDRVCHYGIRNSLRNWDPLWANVHVWVDTICVCFRTRGRWQKLSVWFRAPSWIPEDIDVSCVPEETGGKYRPKVSLKSQIFVGIQFSVTSLAGIWLLMNQTLLSIEASFLSFIVVLVSYSLQSMALQKDKFVYLLECFRLLLIWLIFLYLMQSDLIFAQSVETALSYYLLGSLCLVLVLSCIQLFGSSKHQWV